MNLNINEIKKFYQDKGGHGFDHTERVLKLAKFICKKEGGDNETIKAAALLHDIARNKEGGNKRICHAEEGAKMAKDYLNKINFPKSKIKNIIHCVKVHRFSKNKKPKTIEAKIIQDADRLDVLGAICIARVLMYAGLHKIPLYNPNIKPLKKYEGWHTTAINHFYEKILKITPLSFHTKIARKIAKKRYNFVINFLKQFKKEYEGEDL